MSSRDRAAVFRRRRLTALGVLLGVAAVVLAVTLSSGSGSRGPHYAPRGVGSATLLSTPSQTAAGAGRAPVFRPDPAVARVAGSLSLAQQVAQLFMVSLDGTGSTAVSGLGHLDWGGVVFDRDNFVSLDQVGALAGQVVSATRTSAGLGPLLAVTQEGGSDNAIEGLPPASEAQIAAGADPAGARSQARAAGRALRALGFTMTLAPLVDVDNVDGALSGRLFSTDPATVAQFGRAALEGYATSGILAAPGHFPGEGAASADPDLMTATVGGSLAALRARDLVPFAAIARQAPVILMSNAEYTAFDGVTPASLLPTAVDLLRRTYRFPGVVMSDDLDATLQPTGESAGAVAVQALSAGDDLLYISGPPSERQAAYSAVLAAAQRSPRLRHRVRVAVLRDLSLKRRAGLLG